MAKTPGTVDVPYPDGVKKKNKVHKPRIIKEAPPANMDSFEGQLA